MKPKVVITLVDGMRPDAVESLNDSFLLELRNKSKWSFESQTVLPAVTLPSHISLFTGVTPEVHQIKDNLFKPYQSPLPSLFELARKAGKKTAAIFTWEELRDINRPGGLDRLDFRCLPEDTDEARMKFEETFTDEAIALIATQEYDLIFYYFELADVVGHRDGWMSPAYLQAIACADRCLKRIFDALPPDYHMIVTADHGGHELDHGSAPEDRRIPIWFYGSSFTPGESPEGFSLLDIAPTALTLLGETPPAHWQGVSRV